MWRAWYYTKRGGEGSQRATQGRTEGRKCGGRGMVAGVPYLRDEPPSDREGLTFFVGLMGTALRA
jgi:hypothetical protein